jgi:hypothetical protein
MISAVNGTSGDVRRDIRSIAESYSNSASDKAPVNPTESETSSVESAREMAAQLITLSSPMFSTEPASTKQMSSVNDLPERGLAYTRRDSPDASAPSTAGRALSEFNPNSSQHGQSILVQVQAMDSQSFMDHSQEIAQAVRQAMLNLNSLNDVIADL